MGTMYFQRKLKPDRSVTGLIPALTFLMAFLVTWIFFGTDPAFYLMAILVLAYALFSLLAFLRTRNTGYLIAVLYQVSLGLFCGTFPASQVSQAGRSIHMFFMVCMLFLGLCLVYLLLTRKAKWRGREILELAAAPVLEVMNGYTGRPRPVGKTEYTKRDVLAFAEFAAKNLLSVAHVEENRVVFVPVKMGNEFGHILGLKRDYSDETWVSFDFDGNVSVNISQQDYLDYREDLAFDQLCASLGNLFIEFLELYKRGQGIRVIDRMDAVRLSAFS